MGKKEDQEKVNRAAKGLRVKTAMGPTRRRGLRRLLDRLSAIRK